MGGESETATIDESLPGARWTAVATLVLGSPAEPAAGYMLEEQVGFLLRQVHQRHTAIFSQLFKDDLTPTQWSAITKLVELGPCSQNQLGRLTGMDVATIKGVTDRLLRRGLLEARPDPTDRRRVLISPTPAGRDLHRRHVEDAAAVTEETLRPLKPQERATLLRLLKQLR